MLSRAWAIIAMLLPYLVATAVILPISIWIMGAATTHMDIQAGEHQALRGLLALGATMAAVTVTACSCLICFGVISGARILLPRSKENSDDVVGRDSS